MEVESASVASAVVRLSPAEFSTISSCPVRLETSQANGQVERYVGHYLLHRSVVEGGYPAWQIERATLVKQ